MDKRGNPGPAHSLAHFELANARVPPWICRGVNSCFKESRALPSGCFRRSRETVTPFSERPVHGVAAVQESQQRFAPRTYLL